VWAAPFNHPFASPQGAWPTTFEAINMAVIPNSLDANGNPDGKVIVFDNNGANQNLGSASPWPQRFSVLRPEAAPAAGYTWPTGSFANYVVMIPPGYGDMFCSGHVWLPDGRLFVAGGNSRYPSAAANYFEGSTFVGIWDPQQVGNSALGWVFDQQQADAREALVPDGHDDGRRPDHRLGRSGEHGPDQEPMHR
jgi:hypothetical protein